MAVFLPSAFITCMPVSCRPKGSWHKKGRTLRERRGNPRSAEGSGFILWIGPTKYPVAHSKRGKLGFVSYRSMEHNEWSVACGRLELSAGWRSILAQYCCFILPTKASRTRVRSSILSPYLTCVLQISQKLTQEIQIIFLERILSAYTFVCQRPWGSKINTNTSQNYHASMTLKCNL